MRSSTQESSPRFFSRCSHAGGAARGFTLSETLAVICIVSVMMALSAPAVLSLKDSGNFGRSVDHVSLTLQQARSYAISKNTYVWVGFYEEDSSAATPSSSLPPYAGKGRVVLSTIASRDGTRIVPEGAAASMMDQTRFLPVGKLVRIENVHLSDVGEASGGDPLRLDGRPELPYTEGEDCRITSSSDLATPYPFQTDGYTFHKTIRFSPSGEATLNGAPTAKRLAEIGMLPTSAGKVLDKNRAAIQFSGISGNVRVFRQ